MGVRGGSFLTGALTASAEIHTCCYRPWLRIPISTNVKQCHASAHMPVRAYPLAWTIGANMAGLSSWLFKGDEVIMLASELTRADQAQGSPASAKPTGTFGTRTVENTADNDVVISISGRFRM